jgi:TPR repeat protein
MDQILNLLHKLAGPIDWRDLLHKWQLEGNSDTQHDRHMELVTPPSISTLTTELQAIQGETEATIRTYSAAAMKQIARLYLDGHVSQECVDTFLLMESHTSSSTTNPKTPSMSQLGLYWLQAAFEVGNDVSAAYDVAVLLETGDGSLSTSTVALNENSPEIDQEGNHIVDLQQEEEAYSNSNIAATASDHTNSSSGVPIDVIAAGRWFYKAACRGHIEAMVELALLYELGIGGMVQSDEHALHWYRHAAMQGHVHAKYSVGEAWEEARGVPHSDSEEACLWYFKAALEGDEDGKQALYRLADVATRILPIVQRQDELSLLLSTNLEPSLAIRNVVNIRNDDQVNTTDESPEPRRSAILRV